MWATEALSNDIAFGVRFDYLSTALGTAAFLCPFLLCADYLSSLILIRYVVTAAHIIHRSRYRALHPRLDTSRSIYGAFSPFH